MKKLCLGFFTLSLIGLFVSLGIAGPQSRFDQTTKTCRKFHVYDALMNEASNLFKDNCKSCHYRGNEKEAPFLHSESKTPEAWDRAFFERYPKCAQDGTWDKLELRDLMVINDYLFRFGAGTYDPNDADDAYC